jgi:hypothetical protein
MKFLILSLLQTSLLVNSAPFKLIPSAENTQGLNLKILNQNIDDGYSEFESLPILKGVINCDRVFTMPFRKWMFSSFRRSGSSCYKGLILRGNASILTLILTLVLGVTGDILYLPNCGTGSVVTKRFPRSNRVVVAKTCVHGRFVWFRD